MKSDLQDQGYPEILALAEQAIRGGASPAYTMKHLCDSGANPEYAEQAVKDAVKNVNIEREKKLAEQDQPDKPWYGIVAFALGIVLVLVGGYGKSLRLILYGGACFLAAIWQSFNTIIRVCKGLLKK